MKLTLVQQKINRFRWSGMEVGGGVMPPFHQDGGWPTRQSNLALSKYVNEAIEVLKAAKYDIIILETSGIGQSDTEIMDHSDVSLYVMTPEFGAATQLEKIDMLDFADLVAVNKFDKRGALDAIRDVKKQYQRNHNLWGADIDSMPVIGTIASQFNDPGMNTLYKKIMDKIVEKTNSDLKSTFQITREMSEKIFVITPHRTRYLSEIAEKPISTFLPPT